MDAPRIQYARTVDEVSIAYAMAGEGQTLVRVPAIPWSHVQREWESFPDLLPVRALADVCRVAWYDARGCGLSDREPIDFSLDAMVADLAAVLGRLGDNKVALCAVWDGVPVAVTYTVRQPERVSHLVLIEAYSRGSDFLDTAAGQVELGIRDKDWVIYTEMLARLLWGFEDPARGRMIAEHLRACVTPEALRAAYDGINYGWDVTDLLESVTPPALIINSQDNPWLSVRTGQHVAASIPNSRFLVLDHMAYDSLPAVIAEFVGLPWRQPEPQPGPTTPSPGTAVILFADIADSTALTERLGDAAFRDKARDLDRALRVVIRDHAGTPIEGKLLGDGVLAVFTSARQAIEAALACARSGDSAGLPLHLGLHAGDVIREDNNVYGGTVNIAARISGLSAPGEVLVSQTVRDLARTSAGVTFEDRGEQALKGIDDPVRVWAVREVE